MNTNEIIKKIASDEYNSSFSLLYSDSELAKKRYIANCEDFATRFLAGDKTKDAGEIRLFSAPGRTEVGGNHTDHQNGCVLAAAVDLDVIATAIRTDDGFVKIKSVGYDEDIIDLADCHPLESEVGRAASLIRGVCVGLMERGYEVGGFVAHTTSNVLSGSGLSSSAAFEILIGTIINHLFNDGKIDAVTLAKVGKFAENKFLGKPSGLMDQMASSVGSFVGIDFYDTENPVIEKVDFDFKSAGYNLCVVDTKGSHADLTDDYSAIREEMKNVASFFGEKVLSKVSTEKLIENLPALRLKYGDRAVVRSLHFMSETKRAVEEKIKLEQNDILGFLALVNESGRSSFMYLQNIYSLAHPETQEISVALAVSETVLNGRGAFRVHGGGFGGTIQAFVPNDLLNKYKTEMEKIFGEHACHVLGIRPVGGLEIK